VGTARSRGRRDRRDGARAAYAGLERQTYCGTVRGEVSASPRLALGPGRQPNKPRLSGMQTPAATGCGVEPVWAIGKNCEDAMQGQDLEETAIFIRKILSEALGRGGR